MKNESFDENGRVSLVELAAEMIRCIPLVILLTVVGYQLNTMFWYVSIRNEKVIAGRNFFNRYAIYLAKSDGLDFEILSEKPGSHYATQPNGRPLE